MTVFAVSLSVGLGLKLMPDSLQHLSQAPRVLLQTGIMPATFLAIFLNAVLPKDDAM